MKPIAADPNTIAFCGLYCGACGKYLKGKCPGCQQNEKASWCKVRTCCMENSYRSCADCETHANPNDCKHFNNFMSRLFAFVFRSERDTCIEYIKQQGYEQYARFMAENGRMAMKR